MITDDEKWYLTVKNYLHYFRGITSNHNGDFYCLNCFHSYKTENKLKTHYNVCKNHDYCYDYCIVMPEEDSKILKYNHREKSMNCPFIIYVDSECFIKKWTLVKMTLKTLTQKKK